MPTVKILRLGGERLTPPLPPPPQKKKKKKKKKFWIITCTTIWLFYSHYGVFGSFILLIYSSQKVPRSLKFCSALHILVLHMHRKFDVDSIDSFWDMEEQSTRRKERKKEERITGNKKNIKVKNKKSHHYMMTFNNNNSQKELDQNQESSPLLRWSLTRQLQSPVTVRNRPRWSQVAHFMTPMD